MIKLYSKDLNSPGIRIIVDNLLIKIQEKGINCEITDNVLNLSKDDFIIPYGPKESFQIMKRGFSCNISLLIDYYSSGCWNKILFYLKHRKFMYKDLLYSIYGYIRYHRIDLIVAKSYKYIALVSQKDITELKKDAHAENCILIRNGVRHDRKIATKVNDEDKIVLGIIASWQFVSIDETRWFIEDVLPQIIMEYPNVVLRIAGRGDVELAHRIFSRYSNVEFVGPVESLDTFFNNLDIYVATVPKGCGVLNKVLDAFSYRVFTIGISASFSGIDGLKDGYLECNNAQQYIEAIDLYLRHPNRIKNIVDNAYNHVLNYHNFENNYDEIVDLIIREYNSFTPND